MSEKAKKKKKFSMRKLVYNDKYLIIISIIAAVVIWIATSMSLSPETTKTITVPMNVDFSDSVAEKQLGIKCYGPSSITVDVTVSVKKYLAKDITDQDFNVKLQTTSVSATGTQEIPIIVTANDNSSDLSIDSYYPTVYSAYFDVAAEQEMEIQLNYKEQDFIADGYVGGDNMLSTSSVIVSGPKAYVSKVSKVVADVHVDEKLRETTTVEVVPKAVDVYGNAVDYISLDYGTEKLTLTIPVLKVTDLDVHASLIDVPAKVDTSAIRITYSKDRIRAGVLESAGIKTAELGEISYTKLRVGENTFTYNLAELQSIMVLDGTEKITVKVQVPASYEDKKIKVSAANIKLNNVPDGFTARIANFTTTSVTIVGPKEQIEDLKAKDLTLACDLTAAKGAKPEAGRKTYKVAVSIQGESGAWVYGTYEATVYLTKA